MELSWFLGLLCSLASLLLSLSQVSYAKKARSLPTALSQAEFILQWVRKAWASWVLTLGERFFLKRQWFWGVWVILLWHRRLRIQLCHCSHPDRCCGIQSWAWEPPHVADNIKKKGKKIIIVFQSTPNLGSWVQVPSYRAGWFKSHSQFWLGWSPSHGVSLHSPHIQHKWIVHPSEQTPVMTKHGPYA